MRYCGVVPRQKPALGDGTAPPRDRTMCTRPKNLGLRPVYDWLGSSRVDWRVGGLFDNIGTHKHEIDEDRLSSLFLSSASVWKTLLAIKGPKYLHRAANFTPLYASGQMQPPSHSPRLVFGWT